MTVVVDDGRVRQVAGDPDHAISRGTLCGKCAIAYNGAWRDPAQRLTRPLRRVGPKGGGQFEPATWEQALGEIATGLRRASADNGPASVLHTHYTGTCSMIAGNFPMRFFRAIGATEVDPDSVCNKAGHEALRYTLGNSLSGFDPRSAADAACILVWGANPSASAPHHHRDWLREATGRKIVIDPIRHPTAEVADLFLQLRPGSDAALAFGMMRAARDAGLLDTAYIAGHTVGWPELESWVETMPVGRAASLTGVPEHSIREAAEAYARGPSLLWLGQGMQRQRMGGNAFRTAAALAAVTGNIGKPGAGLLYMNGPATRGVDMDRLTGASIGTMPSISHMDLAEALAAPGRYRALVTWNNNILASSPSQTRLRQGLRREDLLHVAIDLFMTDTCDHADWVLPAASFLEFDDVVVPYFQQIVSAQAKVTEPLGEALPNQEIFRRLASAMGLEDPLLHEQDVDIIAGILRQTGAAGSFAALAARGTVPHGDAPIVPFAHGVFATPSGRIELASARAQADGHPLVPFPHADTAPEGGRLVVLSPASRWTMNSSYANDPKVVGKLGMPEVWLNPDEADARDLVEGARVVLRNATGSLPVEVRRSDSVLPGTALVYKGRWPKLDASGANVNVLNPGEKTDIGESSCVHAIEVDLVAAEA